MRVVFDANVLISASLFCGMPSRIREASRTGEVVLDMAPDIVDEYVRVAERLEERYANVEVQPIIAHVVRNATLFPTTRFPTPVSDYPDDDKFLACARAIGTDIVVGGDKKLREASGYEGIRVMAPRQFVERFLSGSGAA